MYIVLAILVIAIFAMYCNKNENMDSTQYTQANPCQTNCINNYESCLDICSGDPDPDINPSDDSFVYEPNYNSKCVKSCESTLHVCNNKCSQ